MVRGGKREEGSGWGTHVYLWRIHFDIWQNQYNIVKFKNKTKLKKEKRKRKQQKKTPKKNKITLKKLHEQVVLFSSHIIGVVCEILLAKIIIWAYVYYSLYVKY